MPTNRLLLRSTNSTYTYPTFDLVKGTPLSLEEADNNFIFLKGLSLSGVSIDNTLLTLTRINGGSDSVDLNALSVGGYNYVVSVRVATTTALSGSPAYNNGLSGVSAVLSATTNGLLPYIDTISSFNVGDVVLIKNESSSLRNGVYYITDLGGASSKWALTRLSTVDESSELDDLIVSVGFGSANKGLLFAQQTVLPVVGVDPIVFSGTASVYMKQKSSGVQTEFNIPMYAAEGKTLYKGYSGFSYNLITNIFKIRNVPYLFPLSNSVGVLSNDGSGSLSWAALSSSTVNLFTTGSTSGSTTRQYVNNLSTGVYSAAIAGYGNSVLTDYSNVNGGRFNGISGSTGYSVVGGGNCNLISTDYSTISGGRDNSVTATTGYSTIGGGYNNCILNDYSTISGGRDNSITGATGYSVIGGGYNNDIGVSYASILGGRDNNIGASSVYSVIVGGLRNSISNSVCSGILGGVDNQIGTGYACTFIVGQCITANRSNATFVNNLSITSIPTSAAGLPPGSVWSNSGILNIV